MGTNEKKHTFVICAYKESPYLEECIKSVIAQKDFSDIILSTSTPNDYIRNLCEKYSIPMYVNEGESSITLDWEFAIRQARTPVVTIAHQDDVYLKDYSKTIVVEYNKRSVPLIFFTDYYEIRNGEYTDSNTNLRIKKIMLFPLRAKITQSAKWIRRRILALGNAISCPTVAYVPGNLPDPLFLNNYLSNGDWEAWERFSKLKGDFVYIHKPLMAHRIHSESETSAVIDGGKRNAEDYAIFCKFWPKPIARLLASCYKSSEDSNSLS